MSLFPHAHTQCNAMILPYAKYSDFEHYVGILRALLCQYLFYFFIYFQTLALFPATA